MLRVLTNWVIIALLVQVNLIVRPAHKTISWISKSVTPAPKLSKAVKSVMPWVAQSVLTIGTYKVRAAKDAQTSLAVTSQSAHMIEAAKVARMGTISRMEGVIRVVLAWLAARIVKVAQNALNVKMIGW